MADDVADDQQRGAVGLGEGVVPVAADLLIGGCGSRTVAQLAALDASDTLPKPEPWPELYGRTEVSLTEASR